MRTLLLMRGAPGSGKSTFIERNGLKPYTLSADEIRLLYSSPKMNTDGNFAINQNEDGRVWATLFDILENRMQRGEFTVIDACNSKTKEMARYVKLAQKYKYRIYIVDLTDVPLEVCIERNIDRGVKAVPTPAIENIYSRFATQSVPHGIKVIKPNEIDIIKWRKTDLSNYKKVLVIGDIHGCYTALNELIENEGGITDENFYVFVGDYLDRGIENAEVMKFLLSINDKPNVVMLEGNHERHINDYAHDEIARSRDFNSHTSKELNEAGLKKSDLAKFYRRLAQVFYFTYDDTDYIVTHAGLSCVPEEMLFIPTETFVKGVGAYKDIYECEESFAKSVGNRNIIQIHGHRNPRFSPIFDGKHSYNLENRVENGGYLRAVSISHENLISEIEIKNDVYRSEPDTDENSSGNLTVRDLVVQMRNSNHIIEKKFGHISSFSFSRNAFTKKKWNGLTTKARGLFIDTERNEIAARSYNKFFNINEMPETDEFRLAKTFKFPVQAFVKENGFLGIVGYDRKNDELLTCSKSCVTGDYATIFRETLERSIGEKGMNALKQYCKKENVSLVFECVDPVRDPHIIKYYKPMVFLLDIIENSIEFKKKPFGEVLMVSEHLCCPCKEPAATLHNADEYFEFLEKVKKEDYKFNGDYIEGFVLEDQSGYMTKLKLHYYNQWKKLRSVARGTLKKGATFNTSKLFDPLENQFYKFLKDKEQEATKGTPDIREARRNLAKGTNIISLRDEFFKLREQGRYI